MALDVESTGEILPAVGKGRLAAAAKYPWLVTLVVLLGGSGAGAGGYFGLKATNGHTVVDQHLAHSISDRVAKNETEVLVIKVQLEDFGKKIDAVSAGQKDVVDAVNELKEERVNKLKEEKKALERKVWRLERGR